MRQKWVSVAFISVTIIFVTFVIGFMVGKSSVKMSPYTENVTTHDTANDALDPIIDHKININTADEEMLAMLDGIGDTLASRIVAYREEHGPFKDTKDIMNVSGIGEKKYEQIAEFITIGG